MRKPSRLLTWVSGWVLATLALGLAISGALTAFVVRYNDGQADKAFDQLGAQVSVQLGSRLRLYEYGLNGVRGAVLAVGVDALNAESFRRYAQSRDLAKEFPGARGFGFIRRVPADRVDAFLGRARENSKPAFHIQQLQPHDGERFVIQFIEPLARNLPAVGLDVASESNRRQAAVQSMRTGQATMTGPITLVQKTGDALQSVLFLSPIYKAGMPLDTAAQREAACEGWSYAALALNEVLSDFRLDGERVGMALFDMTHAAHPERLFASPAGGAKAKRALTQSLMLDLFGRRWRIDLTERAAFRQHVPQIRPDVVFAIGTVLTLLLANLVGLANVGRERERVAASNKAQLATIVENSADAIIGESMDGLVISWNRAAQRLFGYKPEEVVGQPFASLLLTPDRQHEDRELLARIRRGELIPPFDTTRLHRDGTEIDVSITAGAIRDERRELIGVAKLVRNIRERKESERRLQDFAASLERQVHERTAELQRVATLLGSMLRAATEFAVIATDARGLITVFNTGAEQMLGYRADEMVGVHTPAVVHLPAELDAHAAALSARHGQGIEGFRLFVHEAERLGAETREWTCVRKDGSQLKVSLVVTPIREEDDGHRGRILGYLFMGQDITERQRHEAEMTQARIAAEAASTAKSMFLANMSHEIRTPMNAVIGAAHLLAATALDANQRLLLGKVQVASRSLLGIINDVLDLAKIEAGELHVEAHPFSPHEVMDDVAQLFASQAADKGIGYHVEGLPDLPMQLVGDGVRLRQVLVNLVSNAIKFTPAGRVDLSVQREEGDGARMWLSWVVRDTGIGIPADVLGKLFTPFMQADVSTTRRFGGTGLGLSIVHQLVTRMGGEVKVESVPGQGSAFQVRLPFEAMEDGLDGDAVTRPQALEGHLLEGLRILLVDDSDINLEIGRRVLESEGAEVTTCVNGLEALTCLKESEAAFDAVLMDVQMPVMDGYEATRHIREEPSLRALPVLALTAGALSEERRKADAAGMDDFLTKPLDPVMLIRTLRRVAAQSRMAASATSVSALDAGAGREGGVAAGAVDIDIDVVADTASSDLEPVEAIGANGHPHGGVDQRKGRLR